MNFGIMGCGNIAHRFVLGINHSNNAHLVAVASTSKDRADTFASQYNAKAYYSYEALAQEPNVDVVYIATYNQNHKELIELCLNHSKHVICEKPMLMNENEVRDMFKLAKEKGCFLMEAQKAPFMPIVSVLKSWIKELGLPLVVSADYAKRGNFPKGHWVLDPKYGGAMKDVGVYPLSIIHELFGSQYDNVMPRFIRDENGTDVLGKISFERENLFIDVVGSFALHYKNELYIAGPLGHIQVSEFWKSKDAHLYLNGKEETVSFEHHSEFAYYINHAIECIEKGLLESPIMSEAASVFCIKYL